MKFYTDAKDGQVTLSYYKGLCFPSRLPRPKSCRLLQCVRAVDVCGDKLVNVSHADNNNDNDYSSNGLIYIH